MPKSNSNEGSENGDQQSQLCCNQASCQCLKSLEQFNKSRAGFYGCKHQDCENHDISQSLQYINTTVFDAVKQVAEFYRITIPDEKQDFNNAARYIAGRDVIPKPMKFRLWDAVALRNFVHHFASNQAHIAETLGQYNLCIQWFNGLITRILNQLNTPSDVKPKLSGSTAKQVNSNQYTSNPNMMNAHPMQQFNGVPYQMPYAHHFMPGMYPTFMGPQYQYNEQVISETTAKQAPRRQNSRTRDTQPATRSGQQVKQVQQVQQQVKQAQEERKVEEPVQDIQQLYKQLQHKYSSDVGRLTQERNKARTEQTAKIKSLEQELKEQVDKYEQMYAQMSAALESSRIASINNSEASSNNTPDQSEQVKQLQEENNSMLQSLRIIRSTQQRLEYNLTKEHKENQRLTALVKQLQEQQPAQQVLDRISELEQINQKLLQQNCEVKNESVELSRQLECAKRDNQLLTNKVNKWIKLMQNE